MTWRDFAACRGKPTSWFFAPPFVDGRRTPEHQAALDCCARCPVVAECAREGRRQVGMWGGRYTATRKVTVDRGGSVRCDRCGAVFEREDDSTDKTCDGCLTVVELERRGRRDAKRRYREGSPREFERLTETFERMVELSVLEWEQVR